MWWPMISGTTRRDPRFRGCFGARASRVYRGVSTLPAETLLSEKGSLRKYADLLAQRISRISSIYGRRIISGHSSLLKPVYPESMSAAEEHYPLFPARILDDLVLCEARAWYSIHGQAGSTDTRLFIADSMREKIFLKTLKEVLRENGLRVEKEPLYMVKPYRYSYVIAGKPDLVVEHEDRAVIVEATVTRARDAWYVGCRVALYGLMYRALYGITPLSLLVSTHDLSIAVYNDYSGFRLEKVLWLIDNLRKKNISSVKHARDRNLCRVCRYRKTCIYSKV